MKDKRTKEELIVEVAKLRDSHAEWVSGDEVRREEISKMLGFRSYDRSYGISTEKVDTLTWPQIYFEIGKLKSEVGFAELQDSVSNLARGLDKLRDSNSHAEGTKSPNN